MMYMGCPACTELSALVCSNVRAQCEPLDRLNRLCVLRHRWLAAARGVSAAEMSWHVARWLHVGSLEAASSGTPTLHYPSPGTSATQLPVQVHYKPLASCLT